MFQEFLKKVRLFFTIQEDPFEMTEEGKFRTELYTENIEEKSLGKVLCSSCKQEFETLRGMRVHASLKHKRGK